MAKIKYDVSDVDPNESGGGEQPKPGVYTAQLSECNHRVAGEDKKGEDDDLEVVVRIVGDDTVYSPLWDYVGLNKKTKWKLDQFLRAVGVAGVDKKRKGEFDPDKIAKAQPKFKIRVKGDSYEGDYRAKIGAYLAPVDGDEEEDDPFKKKKGKGKASKKTEPEPDEDDEEEDDDEDLGYDADELEEMTLKEVKDIARNLDIPVKKGKKKADYIDEIIDAQADADEEEEEDDDEEDDQEYTYEDLEAMKIRELRNLADELEIDHDGMRKAALVDEIAEELGVEEDDEVPF